MTSQTQGLRPPATPLITVDPYFSVWSMADKLTDQNTKHWTEATHTLTGLVRIDGIAHRFMGGSPGDIPAMEQTSLSVHPTRSIYKFQAAGIELTATFMTPLLMDDLDIMSRPASYVEIDVRSIDDKEHDVKLYFDVTGELTVNSRDQKVVWGRLKLGGDEPLKVLRIGSLDQPVLAKSGDNLRIDWGYLHLVLPKMNGTKTVITSGTAAQKMFGETGNVPESDDMRMPRTVGWDELPTLVSTLDLGKVGSNPVSRLITLVYDDQYSIEYFQRKMRPYWRRNGIEIDEMIRLSVREYNDLKKRCEAFDKEMVADAEKVGGKEYAEIATLAYRQAIAGHKLVADIDGRPLFFSKEAFSNGCICTVDVTYPSSPMFYLFNTTLLKAMVEPIFEYAESNMWPFDFAPHDLGTYPLANGQVYAMNAKEMKFQMPIEECGNMLIMLGVLAHIENDASYAESHWETLSTWAHYLIDNGLDPENQLCTDDFAGHLAHNTNLSLKAILGIGLYSRMADMLGKKDIAEKYWKAAKEMAAQWPEMANDGDHYRLAFDQPGTWSMKYNLVWDKILGLGLFDRSIAKTEIEYYKTKNNPYGLPLDGRRDYTKNDWLVWVATMAESDEDFQSFIRPLWNFLNETERRIPFTDWHFTSEAKIADGNIAGFRNRTVVGGVFIKMLADHEIWKKWSKKSS